MCSHQTVECPVTHSYTVVYVWLLRLILLQGGLGQDSTAVQR